MIDEGDKLCDEVRLGLQDCFTLNVLLSELAVA